MLGESLQPIDIAKKHVFKYARPSDLMAMQALGVSLILQMASICIISAGFDFIGWGLQVLTLVRFFVQFHDMAHFSFFASINLNKIAGNILGVVLHIPYQVWREGHNNHHRDFGNIDKIDISQSILFTKKQYQQMNIIKRIGIRIFRQPIIFLAFTSQFAWFFGLIPAIAYQYGIFSKVFFQKILSILLYFYFLPLAGVPIIKICISIYVAVIIGTVMFHLQHSVNIPYRKRTQNWDISHASLEGSTYLQVPLGLKPFFNGIQYHHVHHLNTNVPTYLIQQCHQTFESTEGKKWVDDLNVNKVGYKKAIYSLANVMYDEESKLLVPFCYKFW